MNKATIFGVIASLIGMIGLIFVLAGGDPHIPLIQWPYAAFQGLVFFFAWGFGVPESLSYLVSAVVVAVVLVVCFVVGRTLARCVLSGK